MSTATAAEIGHTILRALPAAERKKRLDQLKRELHAAAEIKKAKMAEKAAE
jgi:D-mannonate dehydratase